MNNAIQTQPAQNVNKISIEYLNKDNVNAKMDTMKMKQYANHAILQDVYSAQIHSTVHYVMIVKDGQ